MPIGISSSQNGQAVSLRVGAAAELRLQENSSSGYRWSIEELDETIVKIEETGFHGADSPGSDGEGYWRLRAIAAGETTLALKRWRPFEGDRSIVERFAVILRVEI